MKKLLFSISVLSLALFSCKKDDDTVDPIETEETASVNLKLQHHFNGTPVSLNEDFITENGDTIQFTEFKYFLSNLVLRGDSVSEFKLDESYYLVDIENGAIQNLTIDGLDPEVYSSFEVSVGVDSAANHSISNFSGDLDPATGSDGMIWTWASGYKFIRTEGNYKNDTANGDFILHLGGDINYKTFSFGTDSESSHSDDSHSDDSHTDDSHSDETHNEAGKTGDHGHTEGNLSISLIEGKTTEIHLMINIAEMFVSPTTIDIANIEPTHGGGSSLMENIEHSSDDNTNGWFELHHITVE